MTAICLLLKELYLFYWAIILIRSLIFSTVEPQGLCQLNAPLLEMTDAASSSWQVACIFCSFKQKIEITFWEREKSWVSGKAKRKAPPQRFFKKISPLSQHIPTFILNFKYLIRVWEKKIWKHKNDLFLLS